MPEPQCSNHATEIALLKQGTENLKYTQKSMSEKLEELDKKVTKGFEQVTLEINNIKNDMRWWMLIGGGIISVIPSVFQYISKLNFH